MTATTPVGSPTGHLAPDEGSSRGWPTVLYFHHVHPTLDHYTAVRPAELAAMLDLVLERFELVDPADVAAGGIRPSAGRPRLLLTFDDGHRDVRRWGLPLLAARDIRALFFVVTDAVERRSEGGGGPSMTWDELAGLRDLGHVVGSHTAGHVRLAEQPTTTVRLQVRRADDALSRHLGVGRPPFAYPYGSVPAGSPDLPELQGRLAFGTVRSPAQPWDVQPLAVRRTYLPSRQPERWAPLLDRWAQQC